MNGTKAIAFVKYIYLNLHSTFTFSNTYSSLVSLYIRAVPQVSVISRYVVKLFFIKQLNIYIINKYYSKMKYKNKTLHGLALNLFVFTTCFDFKILISDSIKSKKFTIQFLTW